MLTIRILILAIFKCNDMWKLIKENMFCCVGKVELEKEKERYEEI